MTAPFTPLDAATVAAIVAGDERAFEQMFRSHYPNLHERAVARLQDEPHAAPRLVVAAMRALWDEREGFHSSGEMEGFLNEELRHRARAIRARMAAVHRFEKNEGVTEHAHHAPPTVDQLWTELKTAIHTTPMDAATAAKHRREHAAHGAAEHIAHVAAPRSWRNAVIMSVLGAILLGAGYVWASRASQSSVVTAMLAASDAASVVTRAGQLGSVTLADGSVARLAADTRLIAVPRFGQEYRTATTSGSAAITVAADKPMPLEMRLGAFSVRASGGVFAVRDYNDELVRYARAIEGDLELNGPGVTRTLKPGEAVVIGRDSTVRDATADESAFAFAWLDGKLILQNSAMRDVRSQLFRWYAVDIAIPDSALLDRSLSLDVPLESSQAAITAIESLADLKFEWDDRQMVFRDARRPARR
ncbi:MAG: FecR domain-containing protein [Gemmatimonadaceae bacterium]